ncbi:MAG: GNAT family N-acetyltransferase [Rhodospirillaceae bacterium]
MGAPSITEIDGSDPELAEQLRAAGLPTDDLAEPGRRFFRFGERRDGLIGFIGWEDPGGGALLRSLVVVPTRRGRGWSRAMIGWALLRLAESGATDAYILTTTIAPLTVKLGFRTIERAHAPASIRASRQLATLCPATATLLHRSLP